MDEVELSENVEVAPQQTESMVADQNEATVDERIVQKEQENAVQQNNFKALREKQKDLERELRMQREMNERLMQMTAQNQPKVQEVDEFEGISDEEFIPKGKVKKLVERERNKIVNEARQEVEKVLHEREQARFMERLKGKYSDFDEIVNSETLAILEQQDPELAMAIASSKDPYQIGLQSYKYIKSMNLAEKAPEVRRAKEVNKKLDQNAKTVQSPQAYDKRPLAQAYRLTEGEKTKLYEEMTLAARQAGFSY